MYIYKYIINIYDIQEKKNRLSYISHKGFFSQIKVFHLLHSTSLLNLSVQKVQVQKI